MGKGHDIDHMTLAALEGEAMGRVVVVMKRRCKDGRRVLEWSDAGTRLSHVEGREGHMSVPVRKANGASARPLYLS